MFQQNRAAVIGAGIGGVLGAGARRWQDARLESGAQAALSEVTSWSQSPQAQEMNPTQYAINLLSIIGRHGLQPGPMFQTLVGAKREEWASKGAGDIAAKVLPRVKSAAFQQATDDAGFTPTGEIQGPDTTEENPWVGAAKRGQISLDDVRALWTANQQEEQRKDQLARQERADQERRAQNWRENLWKERVQGRLDARDDAARDKEENERKAYGMAIRALPDVPTSPYPYAAEGQDGFVPLEDTEQAGEEWGAAEQARTAEREALATQGGKAAYDVAKTNFDFQLRQDKELSDAEKARAKDRAAEGKPQWSESRGAWVYPDGRVVVPEGLPSKPEKASGDEGGATGYLIAQLRKENPRLTFEEALQRVQSGYRQGVFLDSSSGASPIPGYGAAKGANRYGEKAGEQQAIADFTPEIAAGRAEGKITGERTGNLDKLGRSVEETEMRSSNVKTAIAEARKGAGVFTTGLLGSATARIPGTPAYNLARTIETIKANIGFDKLQQMRRDSPTGGALGQVSDFENRMLQSTIASLEQSQSPSQFLTNLKRVEDQYAQSMKNIRRAYEEDKAKFGGGARPASPPSNPTNPKPAAKARDIIPAVSYLKKATDRNQARQLIQKLAAQGWTRDELNTIARSAGWD